MNSRRLPTQISRRALLAGALGACASSACKQPERKESPRVPASASAPGLAPTKVAPDLAIPAAAGDLAFALALYQEAGKGLGNLAFSPFALRTALSMVLEGAKGATKEELASLLRLPGDNPLGAMGALQRHWVQLGESTADAERALRRSRDPDPTVFRANVAAAAWVNRGRSLHAPYSRRLTQSLDARIRSVDFGNPKVTAEEINAWGDEATRHLIPSFIRPEDLLQVELLLTSAVFMHARWEHPFVRTTKEPFHLSPQRSVDVQTIVGGVRAPYARVEGAQILELPYWNNLASMLLVLPDGELPAVERVLSDAAVRSWRAKAESRPVELFLPEFETSIVSPVETWLRNLGVRTMFDREADLSAMASGPLHVSSVRHCSKMRTDKVGTKLAGIADIPVAVSHSGADESSPVFRADRPFLYLIVDRKYGSTLFMGRVADPRS